MLSVVILYVVMLSFVEPNIGVRMVLSPTLLAAELPEIAKRVS